MRMEDVSHNRGVLVLGAGGGIGAAVADAFERSGYRVFRHGRQSGDHRADVRRSEETERLIRAARETLGRIDIVVNAIGAPVRLDRFEQKAWSDFAGHLDVQLKSAVESGRLVLPEMRESGFGRIIHIVTTFAQGRTPAGQADYLAAKYALLGFTKALAKEVGRFGITVNAVSPGFIKNNFTKDLPSKISEMIAYETPTGRLTTPQDVAAAVLFLASDESSQITGVNLDVSGGNQL